VLACLGGRLLRTVNCDGICSYLLAATKGYIFQGVVRHTSCIHLTAVRIILYFIVVEILTRSRRNTCITQKGALKQLDMKENKETQLLMERQQHIQFMDDFHLEGEAAQRLY